MIGRIMACSGNSQPELVQRCYAKMLESMARCDGVSPCSRPLDFAGAVSDLYHGSEWI